MLPWALQVRLDEGRGALLFTELGGRTLPEWNEPFVRAPCCAFREGGRFAEICDWRALLKPDVVLFGRLKFPAVKFPRFPAMLEELIVRAGRCEAAADGVERATTLRFWTACDGVATRPCVLEAPM